MSEVPHTTIEAITDPRSSAHFAPSPCLIRSEAANVQAFFNRDAPDAERVLTEIFTAHAKASPVFWQGDVEAWVAWCMDSDFPSHKDSAPPAQRRDGPEFYDWGGTFEGC